MKAFLAYGCDLALFTPSLPSRGSRGGLQSGYAMPAKRLMTMACKVRSTTAPMSRTSCQGWRKTPSETISVVAPAGGCGTLRSTITPVVSPSERPVAIARGHVPPTVNAGPAIVKPVTTRLKYPAIAPMACPMMVLREGTSGRKYRSTMLWE